MHKNPLWLEIIILPIRHLREFAKQIIAIARLRSSNKNINISLPIFISYDDKNTIKVESGVQLDRLSEIIVVTSTTMSSTPGSLSIGKNTTIGSFSNIRAAGGAINIGKDCLIAQSVSLIASNHTITRGETYWKLKWDELKTGIVIGDNCWIGTGATILPGCTIGDNSVIAAGAVVTKSVPENEIWGGTPAKKIRSI